MVCRNLEIVNKDFLDARKVANFSDENYCLGNSKGEVINSNY